MNGWYVSETGDQEYYGADGLQCLGKTQIGDTFYYFNLETGIKETGFINNCYYDNDGKIYYGQKLIDGHWYYFSPSDGHMWIGFATIPKEYNKEGEKTAYYDSNGWIVNGLHKIGDYYYYFDMADGCMLTGFQVVSAKANNGIEKVAYFESNGRMFIGSKNVGKATIKTDSTGTIISTTIHGLPYYAQNDPRWAYTVIGGYFFSGTGCAPTVITSIVNYYLNTNLTPYQIGSELHRLGYFNTDGLAGTSSDCWNWVSNNYGFNIKNNLGFNDIINALKTGKLVAGAVGPGTFVNPGYTHEILLSGINELGQTYVYDPLHSGRNDWYYISDIWNQRSTAWEDNLNGGPFYAM